ncbi:LCP family protein [Subtercola sp. YIM 133946]|uniref:LCP family protein n=1 Tax=Subtercola sp. YIM 133946 TaxID=3118909 RepID=UPI002F92F173
MPSPTPPIKHAARRRFGAATTLVKALAIAVAVVLVSGVSVAAIALTSIASQVSANSIDISGGTASQPHVGAFVGGFNVLIVGTDNDASQGDAFGERDATLNDVNILLHVSADQKSGVVVSFPRDLIVDHPQCTDPTTGEEFDATYNQPLNTGFERGGLACITSTIENLTGLDVPYAGLISFNGVIEMTNAVGGVPVCLNEPIVDTDSGLDLPAGTTVISGSDALAFLRTRHGVGDGSDLARISSQQQYLSSLVRTLKSANTLTDVTKLYGLAQAAAENIKLSTSLASLDSMVSLALALKDVDLNKLVFVQYPGTTNDPDYPGKVVPTTSTADELFAKIKADEPFTLDAGATGPGSSVVDGSTGAATDAATDTPTDPATGAPDASGSATTTPTDGSTTGPDVIDGVTGQTAAQQTCANAFGD